jgi:predicted RNA binding protein YcfA (HicA-like mRNA interferase family)
VDFPSLKAKQMLGILRREPLAYSIARQKGSHRVLWSRNGYPQVRFWAHDGATLPPGAVREILLKKVGLTEEQAAKLLKGAS